MRIKIVNLCCGLLLVALAACNKADNKPDTSATTLPAQPTQVVMDASQAFVAQTVPKLNERSAVTLWVGNTAQQSPKVLDAELGWVDSLSFSPNGSLFFLTSSNEENSPMWLGMLNGKQVIQHLYQGPTMGGALSDDDGRIAMHASLSKLVAISDTEALFIVNSQQPYRLDLNVKDPKQAASFISFKHASGQDVTSQTAFDRPPFAAEGGWSLDFIHKNAQGAVVVHNRARHKWLKFKAGGVLEPAGDLTTLPTAAYLKARDVWPEMEGAVLGPDGYVYAVERDQNSPDIYRLVRMGEAGKNSLTSHAARVLIHTFTNVALTGALAFNHKGELAVGAENAIYLMTSATP